MTEVFLNSGNKELQSAARVWARSLNGNAETTIKDWESRQLDPDIDKDLATTLTWSKHENSKSEIEKVKANTK